MVYNIHEERVKINLQQSIMLLFLIQIVLSFLKVPYSLSITSVVFISTFVFFFNKYQSFRDVVNNRALLAWLLLTLYHFINARIKGINSVTFIDLIHGIKVWSSLCLFSYFFAVDFKKTLQILLRAILIFVAIALIKSGFVMRGTGKAESAIAAVTFGKMGYGFCIYALYYCLLKRNTMVRALYASLPALCIVIYGQTRTAFAVIILHFAAYYYCVVMNMKFKLKHLIVGGLLCCTFIVSINYIMSSTSLGARFQNVEAAEEHLENLDALTGTFMDKVWGDRTFYYVVGWRLFLKNPITGIGFDEFRYATDGNFPMHVEYMVHLSEGGIIGAVLFLVFMCTLVSLLIKAELGIEVKCFLFATFLIMCFALMYSSVFKQELSVIVFSLLLSVNQDYCLLRKM